jgi:hypothetical protein
MTAALLWTMRLLIIYFVIKFALSIFNGNRNKNTRSHPPDNTPDRFDSENKNISDGDFKEL